MTGILADLVFIFKAYLYLWQVLAAWDIFFLMPGTAVFHGPWWMADVARWGTPILIRG